MTNWKAVLYGFVAMMLAEVLAILVPVLGHGLAGLVGGFVAGYIAGGGLVRGAWHGLLAGSLVGLLVGILLFATGTLLGPVGAVLGGSAFLIILAFTFLGAIPSAIAGAIGGILG